MSASRVTMLGAVSAAGLLCALLFLVPIGARKVISGSMSGPPVPPPAPPPARLAGPAPIQSFAAVADSTIDAAARAEAIAGVAHALRTAYVFPAVGERMAQAIAAHQQRGEYDRLTSGRAFAELLTSHLREVSRDKHLRVELIPPPAPDAAPDAQPRESKQAVPPPASQSSQSGQSGAAVSIGTPAFEERLRIVGRQRNFEFARVERLPGNVGYLDLRGFLPPRVAGETATAAIQFLASADAVIFDLRENGGGDPAMVAYLTTYLFPRQVRLSDFFSRLTNVTESSFTLPSVPGRRLTDVDVFVLTSARTFSGAEEFAYNLKHLKRATLVGETTGGGAHLVSRRQINDRFVIAVPHGRPIHPVTKSNWEGVGVEPDVRVPARDALKVAHLLALEARQPSVSDDADFLKAEVTTMLVKLREELGPLAARVGASRPRGRAGASP